MPNESCSCLYSAYSFWYVLWFWGSGVNVVFFTPAIADWASVKLSWPPFAFCATTAAAIAEPSAQVWAEREIFISLLVMSAYICISIGFFSAIPPQLIISEIFDTEFFEAVYYG